jgi:hypothetical protein
MGARLQIFTALKWAGTVLSALCIAAAITEVGSRHGVSDWSFSLIMLLGIPTLALWLECDSRKKRARAELLLNSGKCGQCYYDRTGVDRAAPCPECGAAATLNDTPSE